MYPKLRVAEDKKAPSILEGVAFTPVTLPAHEDPGLKVCCRVQLTVAEQFRSHATPVGDVYNRIGGFTSPQAACSWNNAEAVYSHRAL